MDTTRVLLPVSAEYQQPELIVRAHTMMQMSAHRNDEHSRSHAVTIAEVRSSVECIYDRMITATDPSPGPCKDFVKFRKTVCRRTIARASDIGGISRLDSQSKNTSLFLFVNPQKIRFKRDETVIDSSERLR